VVFWVCGCWGWLLGLCFCVGWFLVFLVWGGFVCVWVCVLCFLVTPSVGRVFLGDRIRGSVLVCMCVLVFLCMWLTTSSISSHPSTLYQPSPTPTAL